jgi:hypothetical protein
MLGVVTVHQEAITPMLVVSGVWSKAHHVRSVSGRVVGLAYCVDAARKGPDIRYAVHGWVISAFTVTAVPSGDVFAVVAQFTR